MTSTVRTGKVAGTSVPSFILPNGACDTHTHIFMEGANAGATAYRPPDASSERHREVREQLGFARAIAVQPAAYGQDCTVLLDALRQGGGKLRGIASADGSCGADELASMAQQGVVGLRFVEVADPGTGERYRGSVGFDTLAQLAPTMRELGLVAEVWADCDVLVAQASFLRSLGVPVIVDHMGKPGVSAGAHGQAFSALCGLLGEGWLWVKLSVCRVISGDPRYIAARPFHDRLVAANPERLLWGSDWPYVRMDPAPDAGHLLDIFDEWIGGDAELRRMILSDNPARVFRFDAYQGGELQ